MIAEKNENDAGILFQTQNSKERINDEVKVLKCRYGEGAREHSSNDNQMELWFEDAEGSGLVECSSRYDFVVPGFQLCLHQH